MRLYVRSMASRMILAITIASLPSFGSAQEEDPPGPVPLPDEGEGYEHVERFIKVLEQVRAHHPDGNRLSYERLVNHALEGMLDSLDNFSSFYHPETYSFISEEKRPPALPGLGLTLGKSSDFLKVTAVRTGSAAARAGIAPGDRILKIGEQDTSELALATALTHLKGRPGDTVGITLRRKIDRKEYQVSLLRSVIRKIAVPDAMLLESPEATRLKAGYLHLAEFTAPSHHEVEAALDDLEDKGMRALLLDLRGNPGGLLNISVAIAGEFVPPATEVVFTRGRHPEHNSPPMRTPERKRRKRSYPVAVLIDRDSASASELVAGTLQDLKRATIVGETSYGKGSVQHIIPLDETALRLTIATYHTPSGRTPHEIGITPDIPVRITAEDRAHLDLFRRRDSLTPEEETALKAWKDPVVIAALEALAK